MSGPRGRRARTVTASLAMIVLATEFLVVVLSALVLFGLGTLPPRLALGGGGVLLVLIAIAAALAGRPIGIALGWAVQVVLVLCIVLDVTVGVVGLVFGALWTYSIIVGRRIDRRAA
ncbi:DUF4233 domain-containing protein [uncultured Amnibacterium sp.]|uniref:DUF4233 domain-containing protein n=1 Tax=uncultured Amnibacterium sp. TaxID=1631851 RepID=UPI0035C96AF8